METFGFYLLRSAVWITGFALVYLLFLRNERFFLLNRIYLIIGIIASVILPLFTVRYMVEVTVAEAVVEAGPVTAVLSGGSSGKNIVVIALFAVWLAGAVAMLSRYVIQMLPVLRAAGDADLSSGYPVKVLRLHGFSGSFSLFSYVVVNPSITETVTREILIHEMVHIRQKHWFDLMLSSLLCMVQWFNPAVWIYSRFIRQNHEYLADEEALQRSSDPAVYKAVLLNQIAGSPVIDLGNSFSCSLNKKRFQMMKNKFSSPYRKLRLLLILPVAALVLYAFAEPRYAVSSEEQVLTAPSAVTAEMTRNVSGVVTDEKGSPLEGAIVLIKGTSVGTMTDISGRFTIKNVSDDAVLVISHVGYVTKAVPVKNAGNNISVQLQWGNVITDTVVALSKSTRSTSADVSKVLVVIDGKVSDKSLSEIDPADIININVYHNESAVARYGSKGHNGAIEITTKKGAVASPDKLTETGYGKDQGSEVFVVVEEMPEFPGGMEAMMLWISERVKYPEQAKKDGIKGVVAVSFIVSRTGKVVDVKVVRSADPLLDAEAVRVIGEMPEWKPGTQRGKTVDVRMTVPVRFTL